MEIVSIVEGKIPQGKRKLFEKSYSDLKFTPSPTGFITSSLSRERDDAGVYRIETHWESIEALEKMRKRQYPSAIEIFEKFGVHPTVKFYEISETIDRDILTLSLERC